MSVIGELLATSIVVGTLYTLTGPNLSVIATLSGMDIIYNHNDDSKDFRRKKKRNPDLILVGMQWGIGNSIGILLVGGMLIGFQTDPSGDWIWMDDWVRAMLRAFVGVLSLTLGIYGSVKALKTREFNISFSDLVFTKSNDDNSSAVGLETAVNAIFDDDDELICDLDMPPRRIPNADRRVPIKASNADSDSIIDQMATCLDASAHSSHISESLGLSEFDRRIWKAAKSLTDNMMLYADTDMTESAQIGTGPVAILTKEDGTKITIFTKGDGTQVPVTRSSKRLLSDTSSRCGNYFICKPEALAFFAGIFHALSGPGEVLGVIPAVQLKRLHLAMLYLSMVCVISTVVMCGFAAFCGSVCKWMVEKAGAKDENASLNRVFFVELGSACLSIVVGVVWLTLLALGKLDVMAP